jgi:hypothetical protein
MLRPRHVPIEKAFAINAPPKAIYEAIERDLASAAEYAGTTHEVLRRDPARSIEMRVTVGIVPCLLTYVLTPRDGDTEVAGTLSPYGWRYAIFQAVTLGMRRSFFEIALVDALANLKAAVEGAAFPNESSPAASDAE